MVKLSQNCIINLEKNFHFWKTDNIHEIPEADVFLDSNLNFTIIVFSWFFANDYGEQKT